MFVNIDDNKLQPKHQQEIIVLQLRKAKISLKDLCKIVFSSTILDGRQTKT